MKRLAPNQIRRTRDAGAVASSNGDGRIVNYCFSTPEVARDGHTIQAWQLVNFRRNPVFLWAHDMAEPPIGRVIDIADAGGRLTGSVEYAETPFAEMVLNLVRSGFLSAVSVSWNPIKWKFSTDRSRPGGIDFELVDLLEISQVPVPALPTALATARAHGIDTRPLLTWTERALDQKPEKLQMTKAQIGALRRAAGAPVLHAVAAGRFRSLGEQLQAVAQCAEGDGNIAGPIDARLVRANGLNEADPSAGGFVVEEQFAEALVNGMYDEAELAPLCDRRETANPLATVKIAAIDETSRADGSRWGGVLSYWASEAEQVSDTFPRWKMLDFGPKKLIGLAVASAELVADAPMLGAHVAKGFAAEFGFQIDRTVLAGSGVGQPLGIISAPATISVDKATGQAAGTIISDNVRSMWKRLPAPSRRRAVWIVNEDAEDWLDQLSQAAATSDIPVNWYQPAGTNGSPYPLLKGRPVIAVEQAPQIGQVGDIVLADLSQYVLVDGGMRPAISVHAQFLSDQIVFRFTLRIDGQPSLASPISPFNGSSTRSPFVVLGAR